MCKDVKSPLQSMSDDNAYAILNLPPEPASLTVEQVKFNYKSMARQLHPDKCGARISPEDANAAFQALTKAYRFVVSEIRAYESSSFESIKKSYAEEREALASSTPPTRKKKFSLRQFNDVFRKNRLDDPVDDAGYTEWMKSNDPDLPLAKEEIIMNRQMIMYKEPEPVYLTKKGNVPYTELGVDSVNDYSRQDATTHGIQYTDYRVAHTTTKLVDEALSELRPTFESLDLLNKHRSSLTHEMSRQDLLEDEHRRLKEAEREEERTRVLRRREALYTEQHNRLQRGLLGM